jgi:hypothetical protein
MDIEPSPRTAKPEIAGILLVGSGLMDMAAGILLFTTNGNLPNVPVDFTGMLMTCGFLAFLFGIIAILGSWLSVTRRSSAMSMTAAALGMIGIGPFYAGAILGFVALIILALSREEFPD